MSQKINPPAVIRSTPLSNPQQNRNLIALGVLGLALYVIYPLLLPVVMGGVLAVLVFPILKFLERRKFSTHWAAVFLMLAITLLILVPTTLLLFAGANAIVQKIQIWQQTPFDGGAWLRTQMNESKLQNLVAKLPVGLRVDFDTLTKTGLDLAKGAGLKVADSFGKLLSHVPAATIAIVIMVISMYFFLVDGRKFSAFLRNHSAFDRAQTDRVMLAFTSACRSVILATLASGAAQSLIYSIVYALIGGESVALVGIIVFLASFLPLVGSAPVTFGIAAYYLLEGTNGQGIYLVAAGLFVSIIDNVIRPMVLQGAGGLHPLLAFVAVFGGLQTFGFVGVFVGPIMVALSVSLIRVVLDSAPTRVI